MSSQGGRRGAAQEQRSQGGAGAAGPNRRATGRLRVREGIAEQGRKAEEGPE